MTKMGNFNSTMVAAVVSVIAIAIGGYFFFSSAAPQKKIENRPSTAGKKDDNEKKKKAAENKYPHGKVSIFFGSQTGTAEGFARTLMEEGRAAGFDAKTVDLEEFDPDTLAETKLAIFLMATYGEGQPTDNAIKFMDWLRNKDGSVAEDFLAPLNYTVFGLGNRQYEHFNRTGRTCNEWLGKLGAKVVYKYGEGDDDATLEEDFEAWKEHLWKELRKAINKLNNPNYSSADDLAALAALEEQKVATSTKTRHDFEITVVDTIQYNSQAAKDLHKAAIKKAASGKFHNSTKHFITSPEATVLVNRELRNTSYQGLKAGELGSTRHIEIDISSIGLTYQTADNLAILPENPEADVLSLTSHLNYNVNDILSFAAAEGEDFRPMYPNPCSVYDLFSLYLDIHGHLRHATLKGLEKFVSDDSERAWLHSLIGNKEATKKFCEVEMNSLYTVLLNYLPKTRIPLVDFLHLVSPIQPRYYTISSSSSLYPKTIHATVSITEYDVPGRSKAFIGLCTGYLRSIQAGYSRLRVFVRPSTFRLPKTLRNPILLIGPGTGIAPMRALLQERSYLLLQQQKAGNKDQGVCRLFFGCKYSGYDYLYQEELEKYKHDKVLDELHVAFSRETNAAGKKVYVQTLLKAPEVAQQIIDNLFNEEGYVFVCGATAMGNDVLTLFIQLIQEHKHCTHAEASEIMKSWQSSGRYVQELWTA